MARPKEFDRDEALARALDLFWEKGFEATSIQDLVDATKVQRQSLYDTFGDKHALFIAALERYAEASDAFYAKLEHPGASPLKRLRETFAGIAEDAEKDGRGCLMMNAAVERAAIDDAVASCSQRQLDRMEKAFRALVTDAKRAGEVPADLDVRASARLLVTLLWGMRALGRAYHDRGWLKTVVEQAVGLLRSDARS